MSDADETTDASTTARYLVAQVGAATVLRLTPVEWDGEALSMSVTSIDRDEARSRGLGGGLANAASCALLLAGGRGLRVNGAMLDRFEVGYEVAAPTSAVGGPSDDPWTVNLQVPPTWLAGVDFVFLLGTGRKNSWSQPVRLSTGFDPARLEDLVDFDPRCDEPAADGRR